MGYPRLEIQDGQADGHGAESQKSMGTQKNPQVMDEYG